MASGFECPNCGRDDFAREVDMKAHHTIAHGEGLVGSDASAFTEESAECPMCGRDDFANAVSMRAHHTIVHGESLVDSKRRTDSTRQAVIERDDNQCQRCRIDVSPVDEDGADVHVHHIIPRAAGGPDHIENLVTLCAACHTKAHRDLGEIVDECPEVVAELRSFIFTPSE